ncbi:MAG TPA: hypothetical protein VEC11_02060 [Allosphingosinicella sp.]|nr:hypothetical protein [Allosphingosinicella sp.]
MKAVVISLGTVLLLAGCGNEQKRVEDGVRAQLSAQGNVTQVSMTKQSDGGWQGHALVRVADGHEARVNCRTDANGQGRCGQVIDQQLIDATTATLRQQYASRGFTVIEAAMAKQNEDLIAGTAVVRDPNGNQLNIRCTAPRDPANGRFGLNCEVVDEAAAAAASQTEEPPPAEAPPQ